MTSSKLKGLHELYIVAWPSGAWTRTCIGMRPHGWGQGSEVRYQKFHQQMIHSQSATAASLKYTILYTNLTSVLSTVLVCWNNTFTCNFFIITHIHGGKKSLTRWCHRLTAQRLFLVLLRLKWENWTLVCLHAASSRSAKLSTDWEVIPRLFILNRNWGFFC